MARKSYLDKDGEAMELDEEWFKEATIGRPPMPEEQRKVSIKLRLDPDIVEGYRATGKGWQTRMNDALRKSLETV